jgi:hypothetical protein
MAFNLDDYTTVQERSNIFWERYPNGAVRTRIISESDTRVVVVCELFRDNSDEKPFATGEAKEVISDRGVNRDFALENCATSARGVAFKVANIGTEKNGPSREEMARVNQKQAINATFSVDRTDPLPISDTEWVKAALKTPPKAPPQCCAKGHNLVTGTSKTNGKPYYGYLCLDRIKEHAQWAKQDAQGNWYFPNNAEEGKGGE